MDKKQLAQDIVRLVGGKENIDNALHCITRLRFYVHDETLVQANEIEKLEGVLSFIKGNGQQQVVIGNQVGEVFNEVAEILNLENKAQSTEELKPETAKTFVGYLNALVGALTASIQPVVGLLAGGGIIIGLMTALSTFGWIATDSDLYMFIDTVARASFHYLPVLIGIAAAKRFGVSPYVMAAVAGLLVHPTITTIADSEAGLINLFGINFGVTNYTYSVFPMIVAAWVGGYLDRYLNKVVPNVIKSLVVPVLEVLILSLLVITIVGPVITLIASGIAYGIEVGFAFSPIIGGALYAAFFPLLVMFGMHWPLITLIVNDLTITGYSMMNAFSSVLMLGIAGGVFAVAIKTSQLKLKQISFAATLSQVCGVGEPAIFGVLVKYKKVFYMVTIANFIAGGLAGALNLLSYGFAGGLVGFASFIDPVNGITANFTNYWITHLGAFVLAFILTYLFGFKDEKGLAD